MALRLLSVQSDRATQHAEIARIKDLVALGGGEALTRLKDLYPDKFPAEDPFEKARTEDGYDPDLIDDAAIDWETAGSPDEDEELSRWIAERESGSFSAADL